MKAFATDATVLDVKTTYSKIPMPFGGEGKYPDGKEIAINVNFLYVGDPNLPEEEIISKILRHIMSAEITI